MSDTRRFFLKESNPQFFLELLQSEQSLLDTLKGQVAAPVASSDKFELDAFGLNIREATQDERDEIAKKTDFVPGHKKIWRVTNAETEKNFNPKKLKTKLLYHGSKTANYWSLLTTGMKIRPKGVPTTGSMFDNGCYFADKAQKSIGYTSLQGSRWASGTSNKAYLCLFEVATGKAWSILGPKGEQSYSYWMGSSAASKCMTQGFDSVFASAGKDLRMNEYIVYNDRQCTIRYIIEITS
jgi:poly [ADP-ribose] polymerase